MPAGSNRRRKNPVIIAFVSLRMQIYENTSLLLATDLDGTFLGGDEQSKEELYRLLKNNSDIRLVFVTGRGLPTVISLFENENMPRPEFIICDVGATIVHGDTLSGVKGIQENIETLWPGDEKVRNAFLEVPGLTYQEVPQQRRSSYYFDADTDLAMVTEIAASLNVDIIISHGKYVDILPPGINKGSTLTALVAVLDHPEERVLVAGDTLNDLSLFKSGFRGVVVGDAEKELVSLTKNIPNIFHAEKAGTGGILEAFQHFNIMLNK